MKIFWYRFLDSLQSFLRRTPKEIKGRNKWGPDWRDKTRPGRRYSRVEHNPGVALYKYPGNFVGDAKEPINGWSPLYAHRIRSEPGWEWNCPNCKEYSIITESMLPEIIATWAADSKRITDLAAARGVTYKIRPKPTAATAGCTNCKYLPGAPE